MRVLTTLLGLIAVILNTAVATTYQEAIDHAQDFSGLPASTNLLTLSHGGLIMTNVGSEIYLKTVSLMTESTWLSFYQPYEWWAAARSNSVGYESWVSFEPELKDYILARSNELATTSLADVTMRAEEALGISNAATHLFAVTLWVSAESLFRPAINWSLTNAATYRDWSGHDANGPDWFSTAYGYSYIDWFTNRQATIYSGSGAFPWTGLGYTFDWFYATNSPSLVGVSEFVIGAQRTYYVDEGMLVDEYFGFAIPEPGFYITLLFGMVCVLKRRRRQRE